MAILAATLTVSRRLLNRARLIAETPAAQTSPVGTGHPSSAPPPGIHFTQAGNVTRPSSTLESFGRAINEAIANDSEEELRSANRWCEKELRRLQHGPAPVEPESRLEFRARICRDYEGVLATIVARQEMTSVSTVRSARREAGLDGRYGRKLERTAGAGS